MKAYEVQEKLDKRHGWQSLGFEWSKRDAREKVSHLYKNPGPWTDVRYRILVWERTGEELEWKS